LTAAALLSAGLTVRRLLTPPAHTVNAVVRVSEGQTMARGELGVGALRAHLRELTFTRGRLTDMIKSHPAEFPGAARDPDGALEDLMERIQVDISPGDFIEERQESDPPRSARVTVGFTASKPDVAWRITQALTDLMIDSAVARQRAALLREQAGAQSAVERAQLHSDDTTIAKPHSVALRLKATEAQAAAVQLGLRAAEEQQALRFELVDPGRVPDLATRSSLIGDGIATFAIALLAACLLAGALDPRVVDSGDVTALGIPLLGQLPPPPGAPEGRPRGAGNAQDAPSPPSDDSGPRV
jgi:hypothetical protein